MLAVIREHIDATPEICGGRPRIAGHRIRVSDVVVLHERRGLSADEIVSFYPSLTLADIHAALAYYFDHREQIQAEILEDRELAASLRGETPSRFRDRLGQPRGG